MNRDFQDILTELLKVDAAIVRFGAPVDSMKITLDDLHRPDTVIQIGLPPSRIDLLTAVSGVEFEDAWGSRMNHPMGEITVPFISRDQLVVNKRATGRLKDLADIEALGEAPDAS